MSIKKRLEKKAAGVGEKVMAPIPDSNKDVLPRTAPGQLMAFRGLMHESEAQLEALRHQLKDAVAIAAPLSELYEVPGRKRQLTAEQFQDLKENLRRNALVTPITVRKRGQGGYEVISGHNRLAVYRDLGRENIPAFIMEAAEERGEVNAFYANLLQPSLPDFSKFKGFKQRQIQTGNNQKQLATEAGIDEPRLSRIMSFADLPTEVLAMLEATPSAMGAEAAAVLARLTREGQGDAVTAAVTKLIAGDLTQDGAIKAVVQPRPAATQSQPAAIIIRSGKSSYCRMVSVKQTLRLDFVNEEERQLVEAEIQEILEKAAKRRNV